MGLRLADMLYLAACLAAWLILPIAGRRYLNLHVGAAAQALRLTDPFVSRGLRVSYLQAWSHPPK